MQEKIKITRRFFTMLLRHTLSPCFRFPGGKVAEREIATCLNYLEVHYGTVGVERMVDFCICQVYAIWRYGPDYLLKWKLSHSFGGRACMRFITRKAGQKYYEDQWLAGYGLDREQLQAMVEDRRVHPFYRFVYPSWEEHTKERAVSTEAGYYICGVSTLLWTPFSPVCCSCRLSGDCQIRTRRLYPELYRIRIAEYEAKEAENG